MTARITTLASIEIESGLSSIDPGKGFVTIRVTDEEGNVVIGQTTPEAARGQAFVFLEGAEAAIHDAALFSFMTTGPMAEPGKAESDEQMALFMVAELRKYRADQPEEGCDG